MGSDLSRRRRTTPGRSSGAPWSSRSPDAARSPWLPSLLVPGPRRGSALQPGEASKNPTTWPHCAVTAKQRGSPFFYSEERRTNLVVTPLETRGGGVWLESTRRCSRCCVAAQLVVDINRTPNSSHAPRDCRARRAWIGRVREYVDYLFEL